MSLTSALSNITADDLLPQVEHAIYLMYSPAVSHAEQTQANQFIMSIQKTQEAWTLPARLMDRSKSFACQFIGATILHQKIQLQFSSLPRQDLASIQDFILASTLHFASQPPAAGSAPLRRKLCAVLAAFVIQCAGAGSSGLWDDAALAVLSLFDSERRRFAQLQPPVPNALFVAAIEFIQSVAEELKAALLPTQRRSQARAELQEVTPIVSSILLCILDPSLFHQLALENQLPPFVRTQRHDVQPQFDLMLFCNDILSSFAGAASALGDQLKTTAVQTLHAWLLHVHISLSFISPHLGVLFQFLSTANLDQLFPDENVSVLLDSSASCICQVIATNNMLVARSFLPRLASLAPNYNACVASVASDYNADTVLFAVNRILAEFCNQHGNIFAEVSSQDEYEACCTILSMLLSCFAVPGVYPTDETVSSSTFESWSCILQELQPSPDLNFGSLMEGYAPILLSLLSAALQKAAIPLDLDAMAPESVGSWREFRKETVELYQLLQASLGRTCILSLLETFQRYVSEIAAEAGSGSSEHFSTALWSPMESCLFALRSIADSLQRREFNEVEPHITLALQNATLLPSHPRVDFITLLLFGSYSHVLKLHSELLSKALQLILKGLSDSTCAPAASSALKQLCDDCRAQLVPWMDDILAYCLHRSEQLEQADNVRRHVLQAKHQQQQQQGDASLPPSAAALRWRHTKQRQQQHSDWINVVQSLSFVVSKCPMDKAVGYVERLATPTAQRLMEIAAQLDSPEFRVSCPPTTLVALAEYATQELRCLSVMCKHIDMSEQAAATDDDDELEDIDVVNEFSQPSGRSASRQQLALPSTRRPDAAAEPVYQPVAALLTSLWPSLKSILFHFSSIAALSPPNSQAAAPFEGVIVMACSALSSSLRTLGTDFGPVCSLVVETVLHCFAQHSHARFIELSTQLTAQFGKSAELTPTIAALFSGLCAVSRDLLSGAAVNERPDIVAEHFGLASKVLQLDSLDLLAGCMESLQFCVVSSVHQLTSVQEGSALKSLTSFLDAAIQKSTKYPGLDGVVLEQGAFLMRQILSSIGERHSRSHMGLFAPLLSRLAETKLQYVTQWLSCLEEDGFPTHLVSRQSKQQFASQYLSSFQSKKVLLNHVSDFCVACRGFDVDSSRTSPFI